MAIAGHTADNSTIENTGFAVVGGATLVGLVAMFPVLATNPSLQEREYHDIATRLLADDEVDAARRGIDRYNTSVRARCH
jgi:hypothetical protein